jgi:two-component system sporulation sensor kinase A
MLQKLGLSPDQIVGKSLFEFLSREDAIEKLNFYKRAWNGETVTYERESNKIFYMVQLKPVKQNGKVVEVIGSAVDITDRKLAENELLTTKELLDAFVANTADSICVLDLNRKVIKVNRAFEEMYGWKQEELIGKSLPVIPDDMRQESKENTINLLQGNEVVDLETIRQRKDGTRFQASATISPIRNNKGEISGFSIISRDISKRKQMEEQMLRSEKLAVLGELAAGVAHEIRNPLTAIKGFVQLLQNDSNQRFVDIIQTEFKRIEKIIGEMLVLSKPTVQLN